ncbi:hypothetical protein L1D31_09920 [Vibrio sp. Isolate23]|uniref:hypothetical protein n=1 Tax=Vibrio sp. Isolate23 TaxID=2908533 RepID=UPI001EFDE6F9|nr:hypothetical protein [Vibrio sp. Isolate23]
MKTLTTGLSVLSMCFTSLTMATTFYQEAESNYIAFEAEDYHHIIRHNGENDGFNVVGINEFTSDFGTSVLPADSSYPPSQDRALLADFRYQLPMQQSTVQYQVVFNTPGTYRLYYRRSMFEIGDGSSYGNEDSFLYAKTFNSEEWLRHGSRQSQDSVLESHPYTNPAEGKFFWFQINNNFVVSEQQVGKPLTFSISDREKGFAIDRFVFSLDHSLDVAETPKDGDGNQLDELANSPEQAPSHNDYLYPMDYVPHFESDEEILSREHQLKTVRDDYIAYLFEQDKSGNSEQVIDDLIALNNNQDDSKAALRSMITLITDEKFFPHWRDYAVNRFYAEAEKARLIAAQVIEDSDGQVNDLRQVTPIRRYMDYAWGLDRLDAFHSNTEEATAFRARFEDFVNQNLEGLGPYYNGPYYTTGYNKEVFAMDVASTVSLLYKNSPLFPKMKEAFSAFWQNVTQTSYDGDNSPHYDVNTGFQIILNIALRHGLESDVIQSEHLLRMMDRMSRTIMPSGQSAKWGKSMESISSGQIKISAGDNLPWVLKMGYRLWRHPHYLYMARKYQAFMYQDHGPFTGKEYVPDLWPLGIDAFDIELAKPNSGDLLSRTTPRITSCCEYNGLLLGRGDSNYVDVQDKLILSTGHHPRAPYMLIDLSYTQHKAAADHRSGIDNHNFNGAHTVTRLKRWSEANKTSGIYINPAQYDYPEAPYPSKEVAASGSTDQFDEVMGYNPSFDYELEHYNTQQLSEDAAYGIVKYHKYQYPGVTTQRETVLLHNGALVVLDTLSPTTTYSGEHKGGAIYQVLPQFKSLEGDNWVLLRGGLKMLPTLLPTGELQYNDTLIFFDSSTEDIDIRSTENRWDPENREWFSASKNLKAGESFKIVSLILPLRETHSVQSFVNTLDVNYDSDSTQITIPYNAKQNLKIVFHSNQPASVTYEERDKESKQNE